MSIHMHNAISARPRRPNAFTLIELLAAITILMLIVSIMGIIFAESDRAWNIGTGRVESNTEGRAALDMIAQDLQYAIADDILSFVVRTDRTAIASYGFTDSEMCFVSLQKTLSKNDPGVTDNLRSTQETYYWIREVTGTNGDFVGRYQLMRAQVSTYPNDSNYTNHAYHNRNWFNLPANMGGRNAGAGGPLADNVAALGFYAGYDGVVTNRYYSTEHYNELPEFVDVFLEVLPEQQALHLEDLLTGLMPLSPDDPEVLKYVEENARRYTTRVHFRNRAGYLNR